MGDIQNLTTQNQSSPKEVENAEESLIKLNKQKWIDFCAVGGLIVGDDGNLTTMTVGNFALNIGVHRQTLYDWKKAIPNFYEKVHQRRIELGGSPARISKVYNGLFLKAAAGNSEAAKLWLQAFAGWKPPKQELEVEHNFGLADLVSKKKALIDQEKKVIDVKPDGTTETNNG